MEPIDWNKPIELMDGTPYYLYDTGPTDRRIRGVDRPLPEYCVTENGCIGGVQVVRNRKEKRKRLNPFFIRSIVRSDLVSLYEEHKMPELDLTKPLRIRREVTYDQYRGERFYYAVVNTQDGRLAGYVLDVNGFPLSKFMKPEELENIPPEPVKHVYYLCFNESDKGASLFY